MLERAERALTTVVATCYLLGVSTRRMVNLVETLGITRLFKSQVSDSPANNGAPTANDPPDASDPTAPAPPAATPSPPPN